VKGPTKIKPATREEQITLTAFWKEGKEEEELSSLDKHLLVYKGDLYTVETNRDSEIILDGPRDIYDGNAAHSLG
jgi:hypothetical protein